jgi:hypothetical protein
MSVSDNIDGFERGTINELLAFIYIARGSAGETRSNSASWKNGDRWPISNLKFQI